MHKPPTLFYYKQQSHFHEKVFLSEEITIRKGLPHPYISGMDNLSLGRKKFIYYFILSFLISGFRRVFLEYDIIKNDTIISKAVLISKVPTYDFLPRGAIHLCYCETKESERGNGYYPLLLKYIQSDLPNKHFYMVVSENNHSSIKGIEKSNFIRYAIGHKTDKGIFKISQYLHE